MASTAQNSAKPATVTPKQLGSSPSTGKRRASLAPKSRPRAIPLTIAVTLAVDAAVPRPRSASSWEAQMARVNSVAMPSTIAHHASQ